MGEADGELLVNYRGDLIDVRNLDKDRHYYVIHPKFAEDNESLAHFSRVKGPEGILKRVNELITKSPDLWSPRVVPVIDDADFYWERDGKPNPYKSLQEAI